MNALLSDKIVENLNMSERQDILNMIACRFEMTKVGLHNYFHLVVYLRIYKLK